MRRVVGLETEYGCLTELAEGPARLVNRVRDWIFTEAKLGLADIHQRDWDEPAGNGGFLFNGGRAYVDMGHLEFCTPECRSLSDLICYDRAGDEILRRALHGLGMHRAASFIRNNIDHYSGATFGCHENYLVRRNAPLTQRNLQSLLAFLTLRILYTGTGRVGSSSGAEMRGDHLRPGAHRNFQMSQRADYITNEVFEWVQFNRSIINTRDEPLADARRFRRLHLLHGDTNVLTTSLFLKVGTTALVLDLLERDRLPPLALRDAVATVRELSHTPDADRWEVVMDDGATRDAVELLQVYWEAAHAEFAGADPETDQILEVWRETLEALAGDRLTLVGQVDWITKRWLLDEFARAESLDWGDAWLQAQDLEYHNADPGKGLGRTLDSVNAPGKPDDKQIERAVRRPPKDTRARLRSELMRAIAGDPRTYVIDWESVHMEGGVPLVMLDPFQFRSDNAEGWLRSLADGDADAGSGGPFVRS